MKGFYVILTSSKGTLRKHTVRDVICMCDKDNKDIENNSKTHINKGDEDMTVADRKQGIKCRNVHSQSNSFLKLRHKMQTQMKKKNVTYEDVLKMTEKVKRDK